MECLQDNAGWRCTKKRGLSQPAGTGCFVGSDLQIILILRGGGYDWQFHHINCNLWNRLYSIPLVREKTKSQVPSLGASICKWVWAGLSGCCDHIFHYISDQKVFCNNNAWGIWAWKGAAAASRGLQQHLPFFDHGSTGWFGWLWIQTKFCESDVRIIPE